MRPEFLMLWCNRIHRKFSLKDGFHRYFYPLLSVHQRFSISICKLCLSQFQSVTPPPLRGKFSKFVKSRLPGQTFSSNVRARALASLRQFILINSKILHHFQELSH